MADQPTQPSTRVDSASRVIAAPPEAIYDAWIDPQAHVAWLPPEGMSAAIEVFEPHAGGRYRVMLTYDVPSDQGDEPGPGKTTEHSDVVEARIVELQPGARIVQAIEFESDDPAFAGTMTMTWTLTPVDGGTEVTLTAERVPPGIRPEDHDAGMTSTLANLAAYVEENRAGP